jgi:hypothetical protein
VGTAVVGSCVVVNNECTTHYLVVTTHNPPQISQTVWYMTVMTVVITPMA